MKKNWIAFLTVGCVGVFLVTSLVNYQKAGKDRAIARAIAREAAVVSDEMDRLAEEERAANHTASLNKIELDGNAQIEAMRASAEAYKLELKANDEKRLAIMKTVLSPAEYAAFIEKRERKDQIELQEAQLKELREINSKLAK